MDSNIKIPLDYVNEIKTLTEQGYAADLLYQLYHHYQLNQLPENQEILETALANAIKTWENEEPSTLPDILRQRPTTQLVEKQRPAAATIRQKIKGGWLGRAAGCLLGKPVEGFLTVSFEKNQELLQAVSAFPPTAYLTGTQIQKIIELSGNPIPHWFAADTDFFAENIHAGVRDDDTDYSILGLIYLEKWGADLTPEKIGAEWLHRLPYFEVYTAERVAYRNLIFGIKPPETATFWNPYREWIGAQIRADAFGWVYPGAPEMAAKLAFSDAALSHVKNGIYGEMWVAAMLAGAFVTSNINEIIQIGLSQIPRQSRLAQAIGVVTQLVQENGDDWRKTLASIWENFGHYHPVHTINNAAIVAAALLHGNLDFTRAIGIAVAGGWDTDCNGATVGSILGVILGADSLPGHWIAPLNDRLQSAVRGFENVSISELAERTFQVSQKL
jgi:ADP-ribosylglycohydrolase